MVALLTGAQREVRDEGTEGGRGGTRRIVLPGGKAVYLRQYMRGGMVRHLIRDRYLLRPPRPIRELVVTEHARACGCPVPSVEAVCVEDAGIFYRGWIVTSAIEPASRLAVRFPAADKSVGDRLLRTAGAAIRSLHDAGVYHVDLNCDNLLVDDVGNIVIIDFDRAYISRPNIPLSSEKGLNRFWRSLAKHCRRRSTPLSPQRRRWLERGYRG